MEKELIIRGRLVTAFDLSFIRFLVKKHWHKVVPLSLRNYAVTGIGYSKMVPSMVRGSELEPLFNGFIETYHYLGYS